MSKLTSFTSASDALIQPTGATNGQTLTWNAISEQFEPTTPAPTTPASNSITSAMIVNGTIQTLDIADQVVTGNKIAVGAITALQLANNAVDSAAIAGLSVTTGKLADVAVTTLKIADSAVTEPKLAGGSVTETKLGTEAITTTKIANNAVTTIKIADGAITLPKLANINASSLLGNPTGASAPPSQITLGSGFSFSGTTLNYQKLLNQDWAASTVYSVGDLATLTIGVTTVYIRRSIAGTSGTVLDATELANWVYLSQSTVAGFPGNTVVPLGFQCLVTNTLYQSNTSRLTGASFDATEATNWLIISQRQRNFGAGLYAALGSLFGITLSGTALVLRRVNTAGLTATFDATEAANYRVVSQESILNFAPNSVITPGLKISESGVLWECVTAHLSEATFSLTEQANWIALTGTIPTPLPIFNSNQVLRGGGSNVPVTDGRITFDIAAGALDISATGSGNLTLGSGSTGAINVGDSTKTTNLNGLVKQPGKSVFKAQRATSSQAIAANTQTTVIFNAASLLGTSATPVTLNTTTGVMTFTRTGTYRISGCISVQSATANARVGLAFVAGTAVCTPTNIENNLLATANVPRGCRFEYVFTCTTVGTFSIQIGSTAALTVGFNQGTIFAPTKTNCIIEEVA